MLEYIAISLFVIYAVSINIQLFLLKRLLKLTSKPVVTIEPESTKQKILVSSKRVIDY
jgi:hypothetical protein